MNFGFLLHKYFLQKVKVSNQAKFFYRHNQMARYLTQDKPFTTARSLEWKTKGQQKNRNPPLQAQMQFITQRTLNHSS